MAKVAESYFSKQADKHGKKTSKALQWRSLGMVHESYTGRMKVMLVEHHKM